MTANPNVRTMFAAVFLAGALGGCASPSGNADDSTASFFVAPDRFVLYNCEQLATKAASVATRQKELQALTAQAGTGADGQLVSALAYRPEVISLRADMNELHKAAAAKNCKSMPAMENSEGRASDRAVR
jgi:hypothetical protein